MAKQDHGIVKNGRGEDQPADKDRAQQADQSTSGDAPSREATGHPEHDRKRSESD